MVVSSMGSTQHGPWGQPSLRKHPTELLNNWPDRAQDLDQIAQRLPGKGCCGWFPQNNQGHQTIAAGPDISQTL